MLYPTSHGVFAFDALPLFVQFTHTVHESGKYWIMGEDEASPSSRKVSSQQDSQENPSNVVQHRHSVARMSDSTPQTSTYVGDTSVEGISTYQFIVYYPSCVYVHNHPLFTFFVNDGYVTCT